MLYQRRPPFWRVFQSPKCTSPSARRAASPARHLAELLEERLVLSAWYVATTGDNANPGTLSQPFSTIQAAANVAQAGDTVFIMGGTYHETVVPANSGTATAPITFEPYNNQPVTIDGADAVTGWTSYSGKIYDAPQSWDLGEGNNQVFVDGKMINEARYPNSTLNVSTPVWAKASSVKVSLSSTGLSTVTIYNSALNQKAGSWVGAIAHIAAGLEWVDQTGTVIASSPGSVTVSYFQETQWQVPKAGNRFYLAGASVALDTAGEWYRNPNNGLLYVWTPAGDNATNHTIEAKARQYGFDLSGDSYIDVQGINLFACTVNTDSNSSNNLLNGLTATYISHATGTTPDQQDPWSSRFHPSSTGIILNGQFNVLENSTIAYSSGNGVFLGGFNNTVENCIIHDVDYEAGDEGGITTLGDSENVVYNTIYNAGRSGIVSRSTTHSLISHNIVHDIGLQMTDVGGIYTWGTDGEGSEISYNEFYNMHTAGYGATGVYLDNGSQNWIVDHNVTWNCDYGLKLNPPSWNNIVVNNTFGATIDGLQTQTGGFVDMTGTVLINNIFTKHAALGSGLTVSNNLYYSVNPQFVDPTHNNYQLKSNSPAINTGTWMSPYTDGYVGSAPDIGAYEFGVPAFTAGSTVQVTAPPPPPGTTDQPTNPASQTFNPQAYTATWAVAKQGSGITFTKQWCWIEYKAVDFGTGVSKFIATLSSLPATGQQISIRLDKADGTGVGTLVVPANKTGSNLAQTLTAALQGVSGVHDLYLVLATTPVGGEMDSFTFT